MGAAAFTPVEAFRAMILREFLLEPRLAEEFRAARALSWVGKCVASPLAGAVGSALGIPPALVEYPVRVMAGERFTALPVRTVSDLLAGLRSGDDTYRSCCRSSLCYAITGSREWAFGALRVAASKHDDWARHHHIYGLLHGAAGDHGRSLFEFALALAAEPDAGVRSRIGEAIALAQAAEVAGRPAAGAWGSLWAALPEVVRLLGEMLAEAGGNGE